MTSPKRCYHDAGHQVINGVRVGFYEGGDVAPLYGGPCDLIAAPHVARAATARAAGGTDGEASQDVPQVADATEEELALLRESLQDFPSVAAAAGAGAAPDDEALDWIDATARGLWAAANARVAKVEADLAAVRAERDRQVAEYERQLAAEFDRTEAANAVIAAVRALPQRGEHYDWDSVTARQIDEALGSSTGRETRGDE